MSSHIELTAGDGFVVPAYQARPTGPVKAALVLVQEIFGLNAHIRAVADDFAAQGYLVLAPAMFHRVRSGVELAYTPDDIAAGLALKAQIEALPAPGVLQDIQACMDHVLTLAGKVGLVGYCWGGLLTWRAACLLKGVGAAVPYYGGGMTQAGELARTAQAPVLAHFAQDDHSIPIEGVHRFRAAHPEVEVHLYPAGHGFNCDHRAAFDATAAAQARQRTLAFFDHHLTL